MCWRISARPRGIERRAEPRRTRRTRDASYLVSAAPPGAPYPDGDWETGLLFSRRVDPERGQFGQHRILAAAQFRQAELFELGEELWRGGNPAGMGGARALE